jgi:hypothetical protein
VVLLKGLLVLKARQAPLALPVPTVLLELKA